MAINRVISTINIDDSADNGKIPVFNSTTKVFDMTTPSAGSQTPWTSEIDADGNNLIDLGDVTFKTGATGGTERPNITGLGGGFATSANDGYFQNFTFNGFQSSQTNVTSLTLLLDGGTNANIRIWVLKPNTA
ncbi:hypothetical protein K9M47_03290 [Candidatus Gracilibacteria bacterium]|nr:hypothetical protein [Candidatus Gracilibacteria bacterium]